MRSPYWIILAAAAVVAVPAHAKTIKAKGAAAAGVCAGALELAAGSMANSQNAKPAAIVNMQNARDFFATMPQFDSNEVAQNAQAFVRLMNERGSAAANPEERTALSKEIFGIARKCFASVQQYAVPAQQQGQAQPAQPGVITTQPAIIQPQPLQAQPLQPQPLETQPLATQPLVINPQ